MEHGKLSKKDIEQLKAKHNTDVLFEIKVPYDDAGEESGFAYIKKPGIKVVEASMSLWQKSPLKGANVVLTSCWVAGDERIKKAYVNDDADIMMSVVSKIDGIISVREGQLKKI